MINNVVLSVFSATNKQAEMRSAIVSGIVTGDAHVSYRPIFPLFL